jgi:hypothetical protein
MTDKPNALGRETSGTLAGYISEEQFAADIGRSRRTVQRWRRLGLGPDYTLIGRDVWISPGARRRWLETRERPARPRDRNRRGAR